MKLLRAKEVNASLEQEIKEKRTLCLEKGHEPQLATVRVGEDGADISYEKGAIKKFKKLELGMKNIVLAADVSEEKLCQVLDDLSEDPDVDGILLFQPLPKGFDSKKVLKHIAPEKDVDASTLEQAGLLLHGERESFASCAPAAVIELIKHYGIETEGKNAVIIGRGAIVGRPLSMLLLNENATVTVCHSRTPNTKEICKKADIIVSATGRKHMVDSSYLSEGQILIDVGTSYVDGKLYGDLDLEEIGDKAAMATPTPGGISGITTTMLAKHTVEAALRRCQNE